MPLDPQAEEFLRRQAEVQTPPLNEMSIEEARTMVQPIPGEPERVGGVISDVVSVGPVDIPVRIFTPLISTAELDGARPIVRATPAHNTRETRPDDGSANASANPLIGRPIVMFFHGGGWILGSIESHEAVCRRLANAARSLVISVDYRLAPEHRFPAAVDDCFAATQWAFDQASHLGGDPRLLFVSGDSAGGNLAAAVCLRARDAGGPPICGQVLVYPITDHKMDRESYRENASGYHLTAEAMQWFWKEYLPDRTDGEHPWASPLQANDHSRLPPALVVTAEFDPLRDEGGAYADRLEQAGVTVDRIECPGMIHGFFRRLDVFDRASLLVNEIASWIDQRAGQ